MEDRPVSDRDLTALTATEAAAEIARNVISAEDYMQACLDRIAALDDKIHAFVHLDRDHALKQARERDAHKAEGKPLGILHGIPVGIKDIFDTADYPTECGAAPMAGRRPQVDSAAVRKLRDAGAVIIGKTVTTECAYFHPGKTRNPHDVTRTPGGSSSGSAAAVAAAMVPLAIGSQTNGSMIRPAAFCGVFGMKPTHGLISRAGALPLSRALDHVGAFARSLDDLALILDALVGHDPEDPDTKSYAPLDFRAGLAEPPPIPPIYAFVRTPVWDKADADARSGIEDIAKDLGAREIDMPDHYREAWDAQRAIMAADMAYNLGPLVDKGGDISRQLQDFIAEGRKVTAVAYQAALRDARRYRAAMTEIFAQYADAIITLSARGIAPTGTATGDPAFCSFWTLTGLPALNLPILQGENNLPIGVQLVGAQGRDARLLRTARAMLTALG